ncbi:hypothetical protein DUNSADRAFT_16587 [Dunaliella salina]|uniref:Rad21/Rec8-like protein C-terminal eukaryotic domain-containing protein n=1 Tax=Dunaliella salina TaxID=3046 RepID=A0ABQ7H0Y1_DUNSA|nr:hypothetical protein DUNSADRAFT_16587 [Dunaliella salina]|eukprot:KAF5840496.1 hypothetical protein DUNSADRAFT_16587 [Dunaliella salina]
MHADLNNLAVNVDIANAVPLTQKLGSFSDVLLEEEDPNLFAMPAMSDRNTGRLSSHASEQEEVAGRLQPLPGRGHKGKGPRDGGSKELGPSAAAAAARGSLEGVDAFAEQDEMFNMGDVDVLMMEDGLIGAGLDAAPQDQMDLNNRAAALEQQERRASLVADLRAEFEQGDREDLPEWEEGQEGEGEREMGVCKKRGRGGAAKAGQRQQQPSKRRGYAALPLHKPKTDALEEVQIRTKDFRDWTLDSSPLLVPRGFKCKGHDALLLTSSSKADIISGPAVRKSAAAATQGLGGTLRDAYALDPLVIWSPPAYTQDPASGNTGNGAGAAEGPRLVLCQEMQEVVASALYGHPKDGAPEGGREAAAEPSSKRQRTTRANAAAEAAAAAASESGIERRHEDEQEAGGAQDMALAHDEAELHDQLHELPFGNVEVERLRAGSALTPGAAAAALADPAAMDSGQRQQLLQQGLLQRPPGSAHTSASNDSSLHLGARPGARRGSSMAGSDNNDLMLPGSRGATPQELLMEGTAGGDERAGSAADRRRHSRPQLQQQPALMRWGEGTLMDLLPSVEGEGLGLDHLGLRADSEDQPHPAQGRLSVPRSSSGIGSDPLATAQFQLLESSGVGTQVPHLRDGISKHTATVIQILRQSLSQQEAAGSSDPVVSFMELAQQLTRSEAVKLFMQVLVTHSLSFVSASQEEAYGDIFIRAGHYM